MKWIASYLNDSDTSMELWAFNELFNQYSHVVISDCFTSVFLPFQCRGPLRWHFGILVIPTLPFLTPTQKFSIYLIFIFRHCQYKGLDVKIKGRQFEAMSFPYAVRNFWLEHWTIFIDLSWSWSWRTIRMLRAIVIIIIHNFCGTVVLSYSK